MKLISFLSALALTQSILAAESSGSFNIVTGQMTVLDIVDSNFKPRLMTLKDLKFISDRLYLDKLSKNLDCEVRVEEFKQEKKFSTGVQIIEMLKVTFKNVNFRADEYVAFFPLGSPLTVQKKNSQLAGVVEEFKIESNDLYNSQFIFQHNGIGQIVWLHFVSDVVSLPCSLK